MKLPFKITLVAAVLLAFAWITWGSAQPAQAQLFTHGRYAGGNYIYSPYGGYTYVPNSTYPYNNGLGFGPYLPGYYGSRFSYGPSYSPYGVQYGAPYGNPYRGFVYTPFGNRF